MMRLDETNTLALTPCLYLNSIKSYRQKTYVDLVTSSYDLIWPSQGLFLQNCIVFPTDTLICHVSENLDQIWRVLEVDDFSPIAL